MNIPLIKKFSGGDPEALKPMIEPIIKVAPYLNDNSIRNEVECCYTFDFPKFDTEMQKRMHFFYDKDEKACRTLSEAGTEGLSPGGLPYCKRIWALDLLLQAYWGIY